MTILTTLQTASPDAARQIILNNGGVDGVIHQQVIDKVTANAVGNATVFNVKAGYVALAK